MIEEIRLRFLTDNLTQHLITAYHVYGIIINLFPWPARHWLFYLKYAAAFRILATASFS